MNGEFIVGNEQDEACTHRTYTYMGSRHSTCAVLAASPHDALNTHAYRTGHDSKHIERERERKNSIHAGQRNGIAAFNFPWVLQK